MINFKNIKPEVLGRSQKGQDSFCEAILQAIGVEKGFFVEFGAVDGVQSSNSYHLRVNKGWDGLLLEGGQSNPAINLHDEFLTAENICSVFEKYNVPTDFGFLSQDTDGMDYWLLKALLQKYRPSLIMVEINARCSPYRNLIQKYNPTFRWDGRSWYGSSALSMQKMAARFEYTPVGVYLDDMFLVDNKFLTPDEINVKLADIYEQNQEIYLSHGDCIFNPDDFQEYE